MFEKHNECFLCRYVVHLHDTSSLFFMSPSSLTPVFWFPSCFHIFLLQLVCCILLFYLTVYIMLSHLIKNSMNSCEQLNYTPLGRYQVDNYSFQLFSSQWKTVLFFLSDIFTPYPLCQHQIFHKLFPCSECLLINLRTAELYTGSCL